MKKYIFVCWVSLMMNPLHAQIYKWTDNNGVVHFSDKPHPGAQQIELPPTQLYTAPTPPAEAASGPPPNTVPEEITYTVTITQPEDQATIRNNQGYVPVVVQIEPELGADNKLQMIFDGAPLGKPQPTAVFALRDINRGAHTIAVQVINAEGEVAATSETITINMHRPMAGMVPQTRPAPRAS